MTVRVKSASEVAPFGPVARIVYVAALCVLVGVPEITPVDVLRVKPAGNDAVE